MKAVFFDLGWTLVTTSHKGFEDYMGELADAAGQKLGMGSSERNEFRYLFLQEWKRWSHDTYPVSLFFEDFLGEIISAEDIAASMAGINCRDLEMWEPMPGATEVLVELKRRGFKLGIISNGVYTQQHIRELIVKCNLPDVDSLVVSSTVGMLKPDSRIFQTGLAELNVVAADSAFVGDSYPADMVGANGVGFAKTFLLAREDEEPHDDCVFIRSLPELLQFVPAIAE